MLRSIIVAAALLVPGVAQAAPLDISVTEETDRSIVHIRDPDGELVTPKVVNSRRGLMLSFEGEQIEVARIKSTGYRLGYAQTGQYNKRAVIRLVQRARRKGGIAEHTEIEKVEGGLDVVIEHAEPPPPVAAKPRSKSRPAPAPAPVVEQPEAPTTEQTIEALSAKLGPEPADISSKDAEPAAPIADAPEVAPVEAAAAIASVTPGIDSADEPLFSDEGSAAEAPLTGGNETPAGFAAWTLIPSIFGLVGLALWMRRRKSDQIEKSGLEVLNRTALGPKQQIVSIRVGDRHMLLGVTEHQIGVLTELPEQGQATPTGHTTAQSGGSVLSSAARPEVPAAPSPDTTARIDAFKQRLAKALNTEHTDPIPAPQDDPAVLDLRRMLANADAADPAWTREDRAA